MNHDRECSCDPDRYAPHSDPGCAFYTDPLETWRGVALAVAWHARRAWWTITEGHQRGKQQRRRRQAASRGNT